MTTINLQLSIYLLALLESTSITFNDIKCKLNGTELQRTQRLYLHLTTFVYLRQFIN